MERDIVIAVLYFAVICSFFYT